MIYENVNNRSHELTQYPSALGDGLPNELSASAELMIASASVRSVAPSTGLVTAKSGSHRAHYGCGDICGNCSSQLGCGQDVPAAGVSWFIARPVGA